MKWITRSHVHVDRVACPWLITRFIDSDAKFIFVPKNQIAATVKKIGAIPFDAPDVELGHKDDKCSFETIIDTYELKDKALLRLAKIVHSADIEDDKDKDKIAEGLEAIAVGYSIRYPNDNENIKKQYKVCDALYAWCRLQIK